nr:MAG: hypothetical protein [Bacteriophage sp.]
MIIVSKLNAELKNLKETHDNYEKKFGVGSLDNAISYFDPVNPDIHNIQEGIKILNDAIRSGKPLPKLSKEMQSDIIY